MRIPFIKRESEAEKQARIAAKEAMLAAKAKAQKRFWFNVKLVIVGVFVAFVSLIGGLIYLVRNAPQPPQRSYQVSPPITKSSTPIASPPPVITVPSSDRVWVIGYTHKNGTHVNGYWRSKPGK